MNLRFAPAVWVVVFLAVFVWSAIGPRDRATWALEVLPAVIGFVLVVWCFFRYPLTPLVYFLILVHAVILMVGGHYTYAEVPLFDWFRDWFDWERNNYDKLGWHRGLYRQSLPGKWSFASTCSPVAAGRRFSSSVSVWR